jgi:hypothetical protein
MPSDVSGSSGSIVFVSGATLANPSLRLETGRSSHAYYRDWHLVGGDNDTTDIDISSTGDVIAFDTWYLLAAQRRGSVIEIVQTPWGGSASQVASVTASAFNACSLSSNTIYIWSSSAGTTNAYQGNAGDFWVVRNRSFSTTELEVLARGYTPLQLGVVPDVHIPMWNNANNTDLMGNTTYTINAAGTTAEHPFVLSPYMPVPTVAEVDAPPTGGGGSVPIFMYSYRKRRVS